MAPAALDTLAADTAQRSASDQELLHRFRAGDQQAATELYQRYGERLRALARTRTSPLLTSLIDADDIVQSVFRRFFEKVSSGCYEVPAGEELWKLFLVIALNKIRDAGAFHQAARRDVRLCQHSATLDQQLPDPRRTETDSALHLVIDEFMGTLPEVSRHMMEMRIAGYEVAEIAEKTGRSRRTVERLLQELRKKLREVLDEGD